MDSRIIKGTFYFVIIIIIFAMCSGCSEGSGIRISERNVFTSITKDGTPVTFTAQVPLTNKVGRHIIDNALDKLIKEYTFNELAQNCEEIALDLENYFGFYELKVGLETQYNTASLWPKNNHCSLILNKPKL